MDERFFESITPFAGNILQTAPLSPSFPLTVAPCTDSPGTVVLVSGSSLDCARYNIIATNPWMTLSSKEENLSIRLGEESFDFSEDPLNLVEGILKHFNEDFKALDPSEFCRLHHLPVIAGLFGYLSYDLKDRIEVLPNTCMDQNLPDLYLCAPSKILIQDRESGGMVELCAELVWPDGAYGSMYGAHGVTCENSEGNQPTNVEKDSFSIDPEGFQSNFTKSEYVEAVERIIEYIKAGDIYQANFSQRFSAGFQGNPYALFLRLFETNPAPFFSYINAGDHQVISTSPERFIRQNGRTIETRPIKGTIQRGEDPDEDARLGQTLMDSRKDDAELSMIVDLMRNDLGKVSEGGSVRVTEHKRLEPYDNVFHLVSVVEGTLAPEKNAVDLIRATFPGGSITGCPKIRSMEIIDALETVRRHVYTGSIGYISFHDTMDLSIAIRTAVVTEGEIGFSVGGGIVYDSKPESEFEETLHKGKTLMETLVKASGSVAGDQSQFRNASEMAYPYAPTTFMERALGEVNGKVTKDRFLNPVNAIFSSPTRKAWVNGKMIDENRAVIPAGYPGFQYGAGLFETLRVQGGNVLRLSEHIGRLEKSWQTLFNEPLPPISWGSVIDNLVQVNHMENGVAAAKIMVARGNHRDAEGGRSSSVKGEGDFLAIFIRPYTHRLQASMAPSVASRSSGHCLFEKGLALMTYPEPRHTHLAAHKSLNYLYYFLAGQCAKESGFDEALILNSDGTVSETNTCALIALKERQLLLPESDYVLPSVTLSAAVDLFSRAGYDMISRKIKPEALKRGEAGSVFLLNALMGAVPVDSIDGVQLSNHRDQWEKYNQIPTSSISHRSSVDSSEKRCLCHWLNHELLFDLKRD